MDDGSKTFTARELMAAGFSDMEEKPYPDRSGALPAEELSWRRLVEIEPELTLIEREIQALRPLAAEDERFCANSHWYGYDDPKRGFRNRMMELVGWTARSPLLRSEAAYNLAYEHLYDLLPDCRDCLCAIPFEV